MKGLGGFGAIVATSRLWYKTPRRIANAIGVLNPL